MPCLLFRRIIEDTLDRVRVRALAARHESHNVKGTDEQAVHTGTADEFPACDRFAPANGPANDIDGAFEPFTKLMSTL